jgi:D-cysteine desulfhydrase/L-cysteate sulfo-lyase
MSQTVSTDRSPERVTQLLETFPTVHLAHLPTPIEHLERLGDSFGVELWVKRDDCTGLALGGNKVRQLEYYLGEAVAQDKTVVLITGAVQSNFVRLAAAAARQLGLDIHIQLEERVSGVDESYRTSGNVLLDRLLGATIHYFPVGEDESAADAALDDLAANLTSKGERPYVIHLGMDHPPIGALGYVAAGREIAEQITQQRLEFDGIVVPSGSSLTHTGLLVGLRESGVDTPVHGICVRRDAVQQRQRVRQRTSDLLTLLGIAPAYPDDCFQLDDSSLAPGYGKLNEATWQALSDAGRLQGLVLDPVYSAKALAGLYGLREAGVVERGERILFVHTGGVPALFGYQDAIGSYLDAV